MLSVIGKRCPTKMMNIKYLIMYGFKKIKNTPYQFYGI